MVPEEAIVKDARVENEPQIGEPVIEDPIVNNDPKTSVDMNVTDAVAIISEIETMEELTRFVKGDIRRGIANAFEKKSEELNK